MFNDIQQALYSWWTLTHGNQCDQIVKLFVQYLAIYNKENLPKSIKLTSKK